MGLTLIKSSGGDDGGVGSVVVEKRCNDKDN